MMKLNIQLFAGGTIPGTDDAKYCIMQVVWSATAGDSVSNKSSVTANVQVRKTNSVGSTGTFNGNVKINGTTISISKKFSPLGSSWKTVGSATIDVPHNSDGTKICNISAYLKQTGTTDMGGEYNANADVTLDTILRESTPTLSSSTVEMGSSVTIYTNRKSDSFTHTIRYAFGSASGTIATGVGVSTTWTPPLTLGNQIPNSSSGTGTIYCDTYSGGTLIGTKIVGITLVMPSSEKPSVSIGTISEANATMQSLNWGVYVQNKSQLSIPLTAYGRYGSSVSGVSTTVNGTNYSGTSVITGIINASGSVGISSTVTDSRSRTASTSSSATFVAYSNPTITTATAVRCLSDGTLDDEGTYLKYSFVGSISPVSNHNGHLFRIGYRQKGIGSYTYTNVDTANYSINKSNIVLNLNLDTSKSYDIRFEANDTFTSTAIERVIDTGFDLMNFNASGKAMAIGKVSEAGANEELFEVGMDTKVEGNINTQNGDIGINNDYPSLYMNSNQILRLSDGLYVGGYGSYIVLRPNGMWNSTGQTVIYTDGHMTVNGDIWTPKGRVVSTIFVDDARTSNDTPASWRSYTNSMNSGREYRFKDGGYIGLSSDWTGLETIKTYGDTSGGPMHQIAYNNKGLYYRVGKTDDSSWENWVGLNHTKEVTFNGQWLVASRASGAGVRLMIPFYNPLKKTPTLYYYSANYFNGSSWVSINQGEISISDYLETFVVLYFSNIGSTPNDNVLVNLYGSITI